jgi:hypothetical protein
VAPVFTPRGNRRPEKAHRGHAIVEQVIADLKNRPVAHLPSGSFWANIAWPPTKGGLEPKVPAELARWTCKTSCRGPGLELAWKDESEEAFARRTMTVDAETMRHLARRPRRRYCWPEIKRLYVEGYPGASGEPQFPTLRTLADHIGAPPARVRAAAARGRWTQERADHRAALEAERQRERALSFARQLQEVDDHALAASAAGLKLVNNRLDEIEALAARSEDRPNEPCVNARELVALVRAAAGFHALGRDAAAAAAGAVNALEGPWAEHRPATDPQPREEGSLKRLLELLAEARQGASTD